MPWKVGWSAAAAELVGRRRKMARLGGEGKRTGRRAGSEKWRASAMNFGIRNDRASADIWVRRELVLGEPKYWADDWAIVGALIFNFLPKTYFWECFLDTLGDALSSIYQGVSKRL